jgi:putative membrane protein
MKKGINLQKLAFISVSTLVPFLVAILIYLPKKDFVSPGLWVNELPFYNAIINSFTALLLLAGVFFVKTGKVLLHKISMVAAFLLGVAFLLLYIIYHASVPSTHFGGEGWVKGVYFFFLISHILLAMIVVPLVLAAVYFAIFEKLDSHRRIVKYTFPVWLYVSVTGVIVYFMISPYYIN